MKKTIHVAVGLVFNKEKQILIAKRPDHLHQGGLWEFPGGKVEQGERVFDALVREFKEEVGITINEAATFMTISHDYIDKSVTLDIWKCENFVGIAKGLEGQELRWVMPAELYDFQFPDANIQIIEKLLS